jgi:uncharacterized protein YndB with AHSA1/START domain
MAPVVSSVDVARPPEEVFPYVTDPSRFAAWQEGVVSGHTEGDGPSRVGTRYTTIRRIRGADQPITSEITEINPPRSWAMRGIDGPVRANVNVAVDPLNEGTQSRVTITVDFVGHGMGKLLIPFIVQQARKEAPRNCRSLKERLENQPPTRT